MTYNMFHTNLYHKIRSIILMSYNLKLYVTINKCNVMSSNIKAYKYKGQGLIMNNIWISDKILKFINLTTVPHHGGRISL